MGSDERRWRWSPASTRGLIEAEAALAAGNAAGMMSILNALRGTPLQMLPPESDGDRHASWLDDAGHGTAHGSRDRRSDGSTCCSEKRPSGSSAAATGWVTCAGLIRDYGRKADGSDAGGYPIGPHFKGGVFGNDLNLPVATDEQTGNPELLRLPRPKRLIASLVRLNEGAALAAPFFYPSFINVRLVTSRRPSLSQGEIVAGGMLY